MPALTSSGPDVSSEKGGTPGTEMTPHIHIQEKWESPVVFKLSPPLAHAHNGSQSSES